MNVGSQDELVHQNDSPADTEVSEVHPHGLDEHQASLLDEIVNMGVDEQQALKALRLQNFDPEAAQEWLILQQADGRTVEVVVTLDEYDDIDLATEIDSEKQRKIDQERRELQRQEKLLSDYPMDGYPESSFLLQLVQHESEWNLVRALVEVAKESFTGLLKLEEQCKQWWPFSVSQIAEFFKRLGEEMCKVAASADRCSKRKRKPESQTPQSNMGTRCPAAAPSNGGNTENKREPCADPSGGDAKDTRGTDKGPEVIHLKSPRSIGESISTMPEEGSLESPSQGEAAGGGVVSSPSLVVGTCKAGPSGMGAKEIRLNHHSASSNDPLSASTSSLVSPTLSPHQTEPSVRTLLGDLARKKHTEIRNAVLNPVAEVDASTRTQQGLPHIFSISCEECVDLSGLIE